MSVYAEYSGVAGGLYVERWTTHSVGQPIAKYPATGSTPDSV